MGTFVVIFLLIIFIGSLMPKNDQAEDEEEEVRPPSATLEQVMGVVFKKWEGDPAALRIEINTKPDNLREGPRYYISSNINNGHISLGYRFGNELNIHGRHISLTEEMMDVAEHLRIGRKEPFFFSFENDKTHWMSRFTQPAATELRPSSDVVDFIVMILNSLIELEEVSVWEDVQLPQKEPFHS